jgi:hypothetical protein
LVDAGASVFSVFGLEFLISEDPETTEDHEDGGDSYDLVNDVITAADTLRTVAGWRLRMQCGVRGGEHLAPAFLRLCGNWYS